MVKGPLGVQPGRQAVPGEQFNNACGQGGVAGGRVLHGIQFRRETTEVMPCFGRRVEGYPQVAGLPVCRHQNNGFGAGESGCQTFECRTTGTRLECQHGRAVGDKQAGQHGRGPQG